MRIIFFLLFCFILNIEKNYAQIVIPGEGIMDVKIGADWDEVEWELGFKGERVEKHAVEKERIFLTEKIGIDFDFMVKYQHLMWLPVTDLYFKDDKINMLILSSYPEYYKMLCADIGTVEGLNFWDSQERVKEIYNQTENVKNEEKTYILVREKGLGVQIFENEVRTMFIFQPQMK